MHPTSMAAKNLWLQIETHFDSRTFNSPFGSSYLAAASFNVKVMLECWRNPQLQARLQRAELRPVRINTFSSSEGMFGIEQADPCILVLLKHHVEATAATFHATMDLMAYVQWNEEQWRSLHAMLMQAARPAAHRAAHPEHWQCWSALGMRGRRQLKNH